MRKHRLWLGLAVSIALSGLLNQVAFCRTGSAPHVSQILHEDIAPTAKTGAGDTRFTPETLLQIGGVSIFRLRGESPFYFTAEMRIDADGAPNAYHPEEKGLDLIKHAGRPGDWHGIVTSQGQPLVQGPQDPYPGYYISQTSLYDKAKKRTDPGRYVDARVIPYIVLPKDPKLKEATGVHLGDFAVVINTRNHRIAFAIFADEGPEWKIGEASIALAELLQIPASPRTGGMEGGIIYMVFPGTGNGQPRTAQEIYREGEWAFNQWGGLGRLVDCFSGYQWDKHTPIIVRPK